MAELLEVRDLQVSFFLPGEVIPAVRGATLTIREKETMVLAGESGSGKTIAALALTRNLPATARVLSGSAFFEGRDLLSLAESELVSVRGSRIAYVFQEPASFLNPLYTVGEQIVEALRLHQGESDPQGASLELLRKVRIKDPDLVFGMYPHQLSGGMNQRAFIAMSLACRPRLLICDEPTTSLDVTIEAQILELLTELQEEFGFSMLFITHNLFIAKRIADRISVMYRGEVVETGTKEEIFGSPRHPHTRELIGAFEKIGRP